jgi:hypothetical protein
VTLQSSTSRRAGIAGLRWKCLLRPGIILRNKGSFDCFGLAPHFAQDDRSGGRCRACARRDSRGRLSLRGRGRRRKPMTVASTDLLHAAHGRILLTMACRSRLQARRRPRGWSRLRES